MKNYLSLASALFIQIVIIVGCTQPKQGNNNNHIADTTATEISATNEEVDLIEAAKETDANEKIGPSVKLSFK